MSEAYIGEIRSFGFNFAPYGWLQCNGQLLPISQYSALFSILGTAYGGNGTTNFALPNLQGNSPMHWGTGAGLNTVLGEVQGTSSVALTPAQMPGHTHSVFAAEVPKASRAADRTAGPSAASYLAQSSGAFIYQTAPATPNTAFAASAMSPNGSSLPHENMQPYLVLNFCICLDGTFPSRN